MGWDRGFQVSQSDGASGRKGLDSCREGRGGGGSVGVGSGQGAGGPRPPRSRAPYRPPDNGTALPRRPREGRSPSEPMAGLTGPGCL